MDKQGRGEGDGEGGVLSRRSSKRRSLDYQKHSGNALRIARAHWGEPWPSSWLPLPPLPVSSGPHTELGCLQRPCVLADMRLWLTAHAAVRVVRRRAPSRHGGSQAERRSMAANTAYLTRHPTVTAVPSLHPIGCHPPRCTDVTVHVAQLKRVAGVGERMSDLQ